MRLWFFLFFTTLSLHASSQDTIRMDLVKRQINLVHEGCELSDVLLYNMHDNENTSAAVGRIMSRKVSGEFFELVHTGKRNLSFKYGRDSVHIDPNRIYTDAGIWLQLQRNRKTDLALHRMIADWRDTLLSHLRIDERTLVIALHNNTDRGYSYRSYEYQQEYAREGQALYKGSRQDKDHFYFVTDKTIFGKLMMGDYRIILQDNALMTDDGSLSVYCGQLGIPYINVEAEHGYLYQQLKMLWFLYRQLVPDAFK